MGDNPNERDQKNKICNTYYNKRITFTDIVSACSGLGLLIVAIVAYNAYCNLNFITLNNMLYTMECDIYNTTLRDNTTNTLLTFLYYGTDSESAECYSLHSLNSLMPHDKVFKDIDEIGTIKTFCEHYLCCNIDAIMDNSNNILRAL